jgi:hypothetical protein
MALLLYNFNSKRFSILYGAFALVFSSVNVAMNDVDKSITNAISEQTTLTAQAGESELYLSDSYDDDLSSGEEEDHTDDEVSSQCSTDDDFFAKKNLHVQSIMENNDLKGRFIVSNEIPQTLEEIDTDVSDAKRQIYLTKSESNDLYKVEDYRRGMFFVGGVANVNIVSTSPIGKPGVGLIALFEGNVHSIRKVVGLNRAQQTPPLSRPKNAKDILQWNIGDQVSYRLKAGAMLPVVMGSLAAGVGFAPIVEGEWQITIQRLSQDSVNVTFSKQRKLGFKVGAGNIFVNSAIDYLGSDRADESINVNISYAMGRKDLNGLLSYRNLFRGGLKKTVPMKDISQNSSITMERHQSGKKCDRKKVRVSLPFLKWTIGTQSLQTAQKDRLFELGLMEDEETFCNKKSDYDHLSYPANTLKKKNRFKCRNIRQKNGITQGIVNYRNGDIRLFAEAKYSFVTNNFKGDALEKNMQQLQKYLHLGPTVLEQLSWPKEHTDTGTFITSISITLDNEDISALLERKAMLSAGLRDGKDSKKMTAITTKFMDRLTALDFEYQKLQLDNRTISKHLTSLMNLIRNNYVLMKAVDSTVPGALKAHFALSGTYIRPIEQTFRLIN